MPASRCVALKKLWLVLPAAARQKLLQSLSQLVSQQLGVSPRPREVTHERDAS
jgi:hypothetical protein